MKLRELIEDAKNIITRPTGLQELGLMLAFAATTLNFAYIVTESDKLYETVLGPSIFSETIKRRMKIEGENVLIKQTTWPSPLFSLTEEPDTRAVTVFRKTNYDNESVTYKLEHHNLGDCNYFISNTDQEKVAYCFDYLYINEGDGIYQPRNYDYLDSEEGKFPIAVSKQLWRLPKSNFNF